ncbi:MAG: class I SAM-dependent methyltransferase [Bacteroidota bacterium]
MASIFNIRFKNYLLAYLLSGVLLLIIAWLFELSVSVFILIAAVYLSGIFLGFAGMFFWRKSQESTADLLAIIDKQTSMAITKTSDNINNAFNQHEYFHYLRSLIVPKIPLPPTRGWAASPDFISLAFREIIAKQPETIVELGSGVSSLFIGHLLKDRQLKGHLHSVDHSSEFGGRTEELLRISEVNHKVSVYSAPITPHTINGKQWQWYDISQLTADKIDLLLVDGPIGTLQEKARYPAIPLLFDRLSPGAIVLLDDYFRKDELAIVQDWLREYPSLQLIAEINTEKGTAVLQKK